MYYRLGKFEDIRRSATRAMKWAKDFRMDEPWSQRGENTTTYGLIRGRIKSAAWPSWSITSPFPPPRFAACSITSIVLIG